MTAITPAAPRWLLPLLLSLVAGAVDAIGFLGIGGLFAAHVTGNLAVLAAHFVTGLFGQIAPLLAVPMFMAVVYLVTLGAGRLQRFGDGPGGGVGQVQRHQHQGDGHRHKGNDGDPFQVADAAQACRGP